MGWRQKRKNNGVEGVGNAVTVRHTNVPCEILPPYRRKKFSTFLVGPKVVRFKHEKYSVFFGTSGHLLNCINGI